MLKWFFATFFISFNISYRPDGASGKTSGFDVGGSSNPEPINSHTLSTTGHRCNRGPGRKPRRWAPMDTRKGNKRV